MTGYPAHKPVVDEDRLPTVVTALSAVMEEVQAVRKTGYNEQQGFNFRGVDAVVNAVGPALRKHRVIVVPLAEDVHHESYSTRSGAQMRNTTVRVRFRFYGPMGDHLEAVTIGEASDAGDKSVSKAHSVAFRVALLQALCIPTDEPDPDETVTERAQPQAPDPRIPLYTEIKALGHAKKLKDNEIADDFAMWSLGVHINSATVEQLTDYITYLKGDHSEPETDSSAQGSDPPVESRTGTETAAPDPPGSNRSGTRRSGASTRPPASAS